MPVKSTQSNGATPSGDWLVVIDRLEACVFRSTVSGAASQCIRAHQPERDAGMRPALSLDRNGREQTPFGFFEPLAGVLRGARRILIFGRTAPFGDKMGSFIFWLCNRDPELAGRIVGSIRIEAYEIDESDLLAKARAFYEHLATARPQRPAPAVELWSRAGERL